MRSANIFVTPQCLNSPHYGDVLFTRKKGKKKKKVIIDHIYDTVRELAFERMDDR